MVVRETISDGIDCRKSGSDVISVLDRRLRLWLSTEKTLEQRVLIAVI